MVYTQILTIYYNNIAEIKYRDNLSYCDKKESNTSDRRY